MLIKDTSGVILAGGLNSRFEGINKANIIIGGKRIIERITDVFQDIFAEIIIVANDPEALMDTGEFILVPDFYRGMGPLGGIHAGMKASSGTSVFVIASDMPYPEKGLIREMMDDYSRKKCEILVPKTGNRIEPLYAVYRNTLAEKLSGYLEEGSRLGVYEFINRSDTAFFELPAADSRYRAFTNINSLDEADRINAILENGNREV